VTAIGAELFVGWSPLRRRTDHRALDPAEAAPQSHAWRGRSRRTNRSQRRHRQPLSLAGLAGGVMKLQEVPARASLPRQWRTDMGDTES